jgi:hypothetical protein
MASYTEVTVRGPLFDGEASAALRDYSDQLSQNLAQQAQRIIQDKARRFNKSGRGGTGRAADSVNIRGAGSSYMVVGNSNAGEVWWPWLEGTSKRNFTTRFKGYHVFRLAQNIVNKRARKLGEEELQKYLPEMN